MAVGESQGTVSAGRVASCLAIDSLLIHEPRVQKDAQHEQTKHAHLSEL